MPAAELESKSPAEVLGVSESASPDQIEEAYCRQIEQHENDRGQLGLIVWAYDVLQNNSRDPGAAHDEVIPAHLIPGLNWGNLRLEQQPNVIEMPKRTGASASHANNWQECEDEEAIPQPSLRPRQELDVLVEMSEISDSEADSLDPDLEEEDEVVEQVVLTPENQSLLRPRMRKSLIGDGEKEIVGVQAAHSQNRQVAERVAALVATLGPNKTADGSLLIAIRECHSVSLGEVSARTKVNIRHLQNLEADNYQEMPATVYFRGFIDSYLRYFGLRNVELVNRYIARYQAIKRGR